MNKRHYEHTLPNIRGSLSNTYPDLHFLHAEKTCNRVMAYTKSPVNKTVYQEKNGKIIPYVPALKKVSKTKRNNSLKM